MKPINYLKIFISTALVITSVSCSDEETNFATSSESVGQETSEGSVGESDAVSAILPGKSEVQDSDEELLDDSEDLEDNLTEVEEDLTEPSSLLPSEEGSLDPEESSPIQLPMEQAEGETSLSEPSSIQEEVEQVQALCSNAKGLATMKEFVQEVAFAEVKDCNWGQDGNEPLDNINNTFQVARVEQNFELDFALAKNTQICSMDIDVPRQDMLFDDHMLLTLNDYVVTSSVDFTIPKLNTNALPIEDGLTKYSWKDFKGMPFSGGIFKGIKPYCVGVDTAALSSDEYKAVCDIPVTDTFGSMTIDIPEATATKMAIKIKEKSIEDSKLKFNLITTGDNDRYDCKHKVFNFSIKVKYID